MEKIVILKRVKDVIYYTGTERVTDKKYLLGIDVKT